MHRCAGAGAALLALLAGTGCAAHRPHDSRHTLVFKSGGAATIEAEDAGLARALKALKAAPGPGASRLVAAEYRRLKVFDGAEQELTRALHDHPRDVALLDELALTWRDAGFPQYALAPAYQAVFLTPHSAVAQNTLGTVLFALGFGDDAAVRFKMAADLAPDAAYPQGNLCYAAFVKGTLTDALDRCNRALMIDPSFAAARDTRARILAALGRPE